MLIFFRILIVEFEILKEVKNEKKGVKLIWFKVIKTNTDLCTTPDKHIFQHYHIVA